MTGPDPTRPTRAPEGVDPESFRRGYEPAGVRVGPLAVATAGLFVLLAVAMFGMRALFRGLEGSERAGLGDPPPMAERRQTPPEPRLQVAPARELAEHRAHVGQLLGETAWIDRAAGVVRIPIERAMELTAERGLPVRPAPAAGDAGDGGDDR